MSYLIHYNLMRISLLLVCASPSAFAAESSELSVAGAWPSIPASERATLRSAGDSFMREFSRCETFDSYKAALTGLFSRFPSSDPDADLSKVRACAYSLAGGHEEIERMLGETLPGEFLYLGSRTVGAQLIRLGYCRKYKYAALPVVLLFAKNDTRWSLWAVSIGTSAEFDLSRLWLYETPDKLARSASLTKLRSTTDTFMTAFVQAKPRAEIKALIERSTAKPQTFQNVLPALEAIRDSDIGKSLSYELVAAARQADAFLKFVYLWHFEKHHTPVCFFFYKGPNGWSLVQMKLFDAALEDLTLGTLSEPALGSGALDQEALTEDSAGHRFGQVPSSVTPIGPFPVAYRPHYAATESHKSPFQVSLRLGPTETGEIAGSLRPDGKCSVCREESMQSHFRWELEGLSLRTPKL